MNTERIINITDLYIRVAPGTYIKGSDIYNIQQLQKEENMKFYYPGLRYAYQQVFPNNPEIRSWGTEKIPTPELIGRGIYYRIDEENLCKFDFLNINTDLVMSKLRNKESIVVVEPSLNYFITISYGENIYYNLTLDRLVDPSSINNIIK